MGDLYIGTADGLHVLPLPKDLPPGAAQVAALVMERVAKEVRSQRDVFAALTIGLTMATAAFLVTGYQQDKADEATDIVVRMLREQVRSWQRVAPAVLATPAPVH